MDQDSAITFFRWMPLSLGDIGTVTVALATVITLIVSVRLARKSFQLTITQINREDKAKVYATALAGLRATFIAQSWDVLEQGNKAMENGKLGPYPVALTFTQVFGEGNKRTFYRKPDDDSNVAEILSVEFQAKVDLIGSNEVSAAFRRCVQKYQKSSEETKGRFWKIEGKETKEDIDSIQKESGQKLFEIYNLVTSLEELMRSELTFRDKKPWYRRNARLGE